MQGHKALTISPQLAAVIRDRRARAGLSQQDLARKIGCKRTYVSKIENSRVLMRLDTLDALSRALEHHTLATFKRGLSAPLPHTC